MPNVPWTAETRHVYETFVSGNHELTEKDKDYLESNDWSEVLFKDAFEEGFLTSSNPTSKIYNPDVGPQDRRIIRSMIIDVIKNMGYDPKGQGWNTWREWIEENS